MKKRMLCLLLAVLCLSGCGQPPPARAKPRAARPAADSQRRAAVSTGAAAETAEEAPLANQVGLNQRVLKQLVDLDRVVNRKLTRDKSVYK